METKQKQNWAIIVVALVIGVGAGYWYGGVTGFSKGDVAGYARAEADAKKLQDEAGARAATDAAKAANPFGAANPLQDVDSNPFETLTRTLNPFE